MSIAGALLAIILWSSLATLSVSLRTVPPLMLIGVALLLGGALSIPWAKRWNVRWQSIATGCYGMLLYHLLFVVALRTAPPVNANLVHYTWPMLIVLLSPLFVRGNKLKRVHVVSAVAGFAGAALAIAGRSEAGQTAFAWGYILALGAGFVWATYSLFLTKSVDLTEADVGLACLISGAIALGLHFLLEPNFEPNKLQWIGMATLGIGPMGLAFYLWAFSMRRGDPRVIGVLANVTPVLSSLMLVLNGHGTLSITLIAACFLVSVSSLLTLKASPQKVID